MSPAITVRPVETVEEYRACQEIQRRAWGITEDGYVVPVATMISVQHAGGLVLGAFDGARLVGFSFGYLGKVRGRWALYSQLTGVDPMVQDRGAGRELKLAQRAWAKAQGLALVAWTYDPLQAGNANFNLHRLGAFSRGYEVNFYGGRSDALNAGLDTDRLLVEWPVDETPPVWQQPDAEPVPIIDPHDPAREPDWPCLLDGSRPLALAIPPDIVSLKVRDPDLARSWQRAVRRAFQHAFTAGYVAMDFCRERPEQGGRAYYVLRRLAEEPYHDALARAERVREMLAKLRAGLETLYGERLRGVYLFGSYARGDHRADSDVDVLVVLDHVDDVWSEIKRTGELIADLSLDYDVLISTHFASEEDWLHRDTNFLYNVRQDALVV